MDRESEEFPQRRAYQRISLETRLQLIQLVLEKKFTVAKAAQTLNLALSTSKLIVKRYKDTKTVFIRENQKKTIEKRGLKLSKVKNSSPQREDIISQFNEVQQQALHENMIVGGDGVYWPQVLVYYPQPILTFSNNFYWSIY